MSLGPLEILVVLVLALLVFGPQRLPEVGRQVGGALREIRRMQEQVRTELNSVLTAEPEPPAAPKPAAAPAPESDQEPDHADVPPPESEPSPAHVEPSPEPGFEGPSGSFV